MQRPAGDLQQPPRPGVPLILLVVGDQEGLAAVPVMPGDEDGHVDVDDVPVLQVWNGHDGVIRPQPVSIVTKKKEM